MLEIYTGVMSSGKTLRLIQKAQRLKLMKKNYKIFYPSCCGNGKENEIYSRFGISLEAIGISEIIDIYNYLNDKITDILIDEVQFICKDNNNDIEDLVLLVKYLEKNNINLYCSGLDLNFANEPFKVLSNLFPYADSVVKLHAVCEKCYNENARKNLRMRNGKPCDITEEVLIERHANDVQYFSVCNECYYKAYKNRK